MNLIKLVLRMLVLCPFVMHAQVPDPCSTSNLGGVAWMDNDYDGAVGANELQKVEGITVQIYDCNGDLVGTDVTDVNGDWHYDGTLTYPVRVEFSNIENGSYPTFDGTGTGTTVQFVSAASCAINLGIASPVNFCPSGTVILPCYATDVNQTSVAYFPYSNSGTTPTPLETASISDVGGLWGGANQVTKKRVFFSAVLKRHIPLGPQGLGGIYVFDYNTGTPTHVSDFNITALTLANSGDPVSGGSIDVGSVIRSGGSDYTLPSSGPSVDLDAFAKVAKVGLGDTDMEEDGNTLWTVNLFQRAIISIDVSGTAPGVVNQYLIDMLPGIPSCTNGVLRPWGLEFANGKGYLGLECTAENTGTESDLHSYVYSFDPNNPSAGLTLEVDFAMTYDREKEGGNGDAEWLAWTDIWQSEFEFQNWHWPQPVLSDIEIDRNGGMTLAFLDRTSFQLGYKNYPAVAGSTNANVEGIATGDIVKFCWTGSAWAAEGTAGCPDGDVGGYVNSNSIANDGLAGLGEFYYGDYYRDSGGNYGHEEVALGALIYNPITNEMLATVYDPTGFSTNGVHWYDASTGARNNVYLVTPSTGDVTFFAKGTSLGDMEILCTGTPPMEIGNRVWNDTDEDGIQDACELPIVGVTVQLVKDGTVIATTQTNTAGEYYFSNNTASGVTWTGTGQNTGLLPETTYVIRIENATGGTQQIPLDGLTLTNINSNSNANDNIDSDGVLNGVNAEITYTTGTIGSVDHTLDFGFILDITCNLMLTCNPIDQTSCVDGNGSASVSVSGGQGNLTYLWSSGETSNTITNKVSGSYTVTVTDDVLPGCSATCTAIIANAAIIPSCTITIDNQPTCQNLTGGALTVSPNPVGVYTYLWSNGSTTAAISSLTGGTYTVTITDPISSCTGVCQATLDIPMNCCAINPIVIQNVECVDNGTPALMTDNRIRVNLLISNAFTNLTSYNVSVNGGTTISPSMGMYGVGTQFTLGQGTGGGGATFIITVTDSTISGCTNTVMVTDLGTCAPMVPECPPIKCGTATLQVNGN